MSRHLLNISVGGMAVPAGLCQFGSRRTLRMSLALLLHRSTPARDTVHIPPAIAGITRRARW